MERQPPRTDGLRRRVAAFVAVWLVLLLVAAVLLTLLAGGLDAVLDDPGSLVGGLVPVVTTPIAAVAIGWWLARRSARAGLPGAPLVDDCDRSTRRRTARAVWRGEPPRDGRDRTLAVDAGRRLLVWPAWLVYAVLRPWWLAAAGTPG